MLPGKSCYLAEDDVSTNWRFKKKLRRFFTDISQSFTLKQI